MSTRNSIVPLFAQSRSSHSSITLPYTNTRRRPTKGRLYGANKSGSCCLFVYCCSSEVEVGGGNHSLHILHSANQQNKFAQHVCANTHTKSESRPVSACLSSPSRLKDASHQISWAETRRKLYMYLYIYKYIETLTSSVLWYITLNQRRSLNKLRKKNVVHPRMYIERT